MHMDIPLFEGRLIRLTPIDIERDAPVESGWTHDPEYLRLLSAAPVRPLSPAQVKKQYQDIEKNTSSCFHFALRPKDDERLIGFVQLDHVQWTHGVADVLIGIGRPDDRRHGYGSDALRLVLHYAFRELNLRRLNAHVADYNEDAVRFFQRAGFQVEVRRRQAVNRDVRRWDSLILGLLGKDWERMALPAVGSADREEAR